MVVVSIGYRFGEEKAQKWVEEQSWWMMKSLGRRQGVKEVVVFSPRNPGYSQLGSGVDGLARVM